MIQIIGLSGLISCRTADPHPPPFLATPAGQKLHALWESHGGREGWKRFRGVVFDYKAEWQGKPLLYERIGIDFKKPSSLWRKALGRTDVPEELEWDGEDDKAVHLLATDNKHTPIGCARILHDGHIGRMAVVRPWRGKGVGKRLLEMAITVVKELGCDNAFLDAQCYAIPFYEKLEFRVEGEEFMDAGIPHCHMVCRSEPSP